MYGIEYIGNQKIFSDHEEVSEMEEPKVKKRSFLSRFKRKPKQKEEYILPQSKRIHGSIGGIAGGMLGNHVYNSTMGSKEVPLKNKLLFKAIGRKRFLRGGTRMGQAVGDSIEENN